MSDTREVHIRVRYPVESGALTLRTDLDWTHDFEPVTSDEDGRGHEFRIRATRETLAFKPVLTKDGEEHWALGENFTATLSEGPTEVFPRFFDPNGVTVSEPFTLASTRGATHHIRVFVPTGYGENTLRRYPTVYLVDGVSALFHQEANKLSETARLLTSFSAFEDLIVVAVHPLGGGEEVQPGHADFVRFMADELKPRIDTLYRTRMGAEQSAIVGGGLGAAIALETAWAYPQVFGKVACLAGRFAPTDEVRGLIETQARRPLVIAIDGGTSRETFAAARVLRDLLARVGYATGDDLLFTAFPSLSDSDEAAAMRAHLALQFLFARRRGVVARAEAPAVGGRITLTPPVAPDAPKPAPRRAPVVREAAVTPAVTPAVSPKKRAPRGAKKS